MHRLNQKRQWTLGVCVVAGVLLSSAAALQADIWVYQFQNGAYKQVGKLDSSGGHLAIVCGSGAGMCTDIDCANCHTAGSAASDIRARGFDEGRHWREYFPPRTVQLSAGQSVPWNDQRLELRNGAITMLNSRGEPVIRFPTGTIVLRDRGGQPAYLVMRGDRPPAR